MIRSEIPLTWKYVDCIIMEYSSDFQENKDEMFKKKKNRKRIVSNLKLILPANTIFLLHFAIE